MINRQTVSDTHLVASFPRHPG